ncbi:unnamed protein product [Boreogadus saida]
MKWRGLERGPLQLYRGTKRGGSPAVPGGWNKVEVEGGILPGWAGQAEGVERSPSRVHWGVNRSSKRHAWLLAESVVTLPHSAASICLSLQPHSVASLCLKLPDSAVLAAVSLPEFPCFGSAFPRLETEGGAWRQREETEGGTWRQREEPHWDRGEEPRWDRGEEPRWDRGEEPRWDRGEEPRWDRGRCEQKQSTIWLDCDPPKRLSNLNSALGAPGPADRLLLLTELSRNS